jgi:predicted cobalt transporter CbtA
VAVAVAHRRGCPLAAAFLVVFDIAVYALLPANPDAIEMPSDVLWTFPVLSVLGLAVFWTALGLVFGLLLQRQEARVAVRPQPSIA